VEEQSMARKKKAIAKSSGRQQISLQKQAKLPKSIEIHYLKTANYRSYHVDGVFGGVTPTGKIYMETFVQRQVTPQIIEQEVKSESELGEEISRTGKKGWIRQIEAGHIMDIDVAKIVRDWLDRKIQEYEILAAKKNEKAI
jgi:hypothetical protein